MYSLQGRISQIVGNELNSANEQQGLGVAVLVLVLIISPVIIFLVRSATITIQVKRGHHDLFWDCFNISGVLLEPGPQGIWAEYGEKEGGQASLSGSDFTFHLKHFAPDAATHSGPGASTQKGSYRRNLWIGHGKETKMCLFFNIYRREYGVVHQNMLSQMGGLGGAPDGYSIS